MKTELTLPHRTLTLKRYPYQPGSDLQAWSAGDEYLLEYLREQGLDEGKRILILNDHFGALSCSLSADNQIHFMSDSQVAHLALQQNLNLNQLEPVNILSSLDAMPKEIDVVVMALPKINRMLCWQLAQLRAHLSPEIPVIAFDKAKQIHTSTLKLFEDYLGAPKTSLAKKKHRLIFASATNPSPKNAPTVTQWTIPEVGLTLDNQANVYSGEKLDLGARLMLEFLPEAQGKQQVIDLGCGNGVLGVRYKQLYPDAQVTFVDESHMALASAKQNLATNVGSTNDCQFVADNCLESFEPECCDLVLCNPPFHQQNAITDHIAQQMFRDAKRALRKGGRLRVIGNRHLGYFTTLSKLFGREQVKQVTQNNKFVIIDAIIR